MAMRGLTDVLAKKYRKCIYISEDAHNMLRDIMIQLMKEDNDKTISSLFEQGLYLLAKEMKKNKKEMTTYDFWKG